MRKLKLLKERLKVCNRENFGDVRISKQKILGEITELEKLEVEDRITKTQK